MKSTSRDPFTSRQFTPLIPRMEEEAAQGSGVCPETLYLLSVIDNTRA